ncbi:hypothetical protein AB0I69_42515 [Streptomyces sp. NPDC050508]|uniref:hypothetical protein n=1 Tax=Streptomyces sp. NPDC050508 TaxID=3155405 RepID=UPI00343134DE
MHDETLSQFEFETDPFTAAELAAIATYRKVSEGIYDDLGGIAPQDLIPLGAGLEATGVRFLLADSADRLNKWYLALDQALAELLTCSTESTRYSVAASRFLKSESGKYHQTRQSFEYAVTVFLLGRHTGPTGDYPPATVTVSLTMQSLQGYN